MNAAAGLGASDPLAFAARSGDTAIKGEREFQGEEGPALAAREEKALHVALGVLSQNTRFYGDPRGTEECEALSGYPRVGVFYGGNHARDACRDQGFGAGWGLTVMGAGFERDIGGCAFRGAACLFERHAFGMGAAARLGPAAPDDAAILDQNAADGRIGPSRAKAPASKRQGMGHVTGIFRAHSSGRASGRSSLTNLSKSSAAWKFL